MCDAPSSAYSAGEWCEAANVLLARVRELEDVLRAWPQDGSVHEPGCLALRIGGTERDCDCFTEIARAVLASETEEGT
jgi:hypothetical protein